MPTKKQILDPGIEALNSLADQAITNFRLLEKELVDISRKNRNPTPANLFYHQSYVLGRIEDIRMITQRVGSNSQLTKKLSILIRINRNKEIPGKPFPPRMQKIMNLHSGALARMRFDMESVYIFGSLLLDQWAYCIGFISSQPNPNTFDFKKLMNLMQQEGYDGLLKDLWQKHKAQMLWLFYQLRFYRNNFIEHVQRPLQKGTTGDSPEGFQLFVPTATQLFTDEEIENEINSIRYLAPKWLLEMPDDHWEKQSLRRLLERTVEDIQNIEKKRRSGKNMESLDKDWWVFTYLL